MKEIKNIKYKIENSNVFIVYKKNEIKVNAKQTMNIRLIFTCIH